MLVKVRGNAQRAETLKWHFRSLKDSFSLRPELILFWEESQFKRKGKDLKRKEK